MSFISNAWDFVKSAGSTIRKVVKKVYEVCTSESAVNAYDRLDTLLNKRQSIEYIPVNDSRAPDFFNQVSSSQVESKIHEQNKKLAKQEHDLKESQKIIALQVELTRLRSSADLIDRSMKNVKIHASSLSVHFHNIRNINGLVDDVNDLRHGLKAVISTINHNANLQKNDGVKLQKIEGIDLEKKDGAISQVAAYDAFDRTRELLQSEVIELSELSTKHLTDIQHLKINAANLGGQLGNAIIDFVDREISPIIKKAESAGLTLKSEVSFLPAAVRDDQGNLVFENGGIKIEQK